MTETQSIYIEFGAHIKEIIGEVVEKNRTANVNER